MKYTTNTDNIHPPSYVLIVVASNAQVYTLYRLLVADSPQAAGGVCCIYWQGKADGGAVPAPFPPEGA